MIPNRQLLLKASEKKEDVSDLTTSAASIDLLKEPKIEMMVLIAAMESVLCS